MNRTPSNEPSNPISRAFSRFFERGKVGNKDTADAARSGAPTTPRQVTPRAATASTPARAATPPSAPRAAATPGTPGFAGTTAGTVGSANAQRASAAASTVAATPTATPTATQRTHTVQKGDTLSGIAKEVYGRADRWQAIFQANRDKLDDPDRIFPGQVLVIPDAPSVH